MKLLDAPPRVLLARFESVAGLLSAAEKVHEAGYRRFDCHSPFPVHGLDQAMGLTRSPLGYLVAAMGAIGLVGAVALTWWTSVVDYPIVISGKPYFSWQAFIPVIFALTILLSAFGAFFGMLGMNRLPKLFHPVFASEIFARVTDDAFFISIECNDPRFDEKDSREFLKSIGGVDVEVLDA